MNSELQLDVRHLNRWRRHLVNAYEVKAGMVFIARKTVWSMPERFSVVCIPCKALYKCSAFFLFFSFCTPGTRLRPPSRAGNSHFCSTESMTIASQSTWLQERRRCRSTVDEKKSSTVVVPISRVRVVSLAHDL